MDSLVTRIGVVCSTFCDGSANKFANAVGVIQQSVDKYLKGQTKMPCSFIMSVLNAFPQLSAEWLMRGTGSMLMADNDASVVAKDNDKDLVALLKDENDFLRMQNQKLTDRLLG